MASHGSRLSGILTVRFIPGDRVTPVRLGKRLTVTMAKRPEPTAT